ncbi:hypothetical protein KAU11_07365 [Candidatus Babeliales bacterium]|nr:hypothetical protein [Candidatus Babeliales bacterium]
MNYKTGAIQWRGKMHHVTVAHAEHATHIGIHHTMLEHKTLGVAEVLDVHLLTPARARTHFTYTIEASRALQIQVYEESTVTGTTKNSRSRNLIVDNAKGPVVLTIDGVVTDEGVLKADTIVGSVGATPFSGQGGTDSSDEFVFPENFTLRFKCTSLEADNNVKVRMNFIIEPMLEGET